MEKTNPPVVREPNWDSAQTRQIAQTSCFDCHSNETHWRWYADVAPARVLVRRDVEEGRSKLNFSEYNGAFELDELIEVVEEGEMPPLQYTLVHPDAKLTDAEREELIDGFNATFAQDERNEEDEETTSRVDNDNDDD
jgi:hypothetical protein